MCACGEFEGCCPYLYDGDCYRDDRRDDPPDTNSTTTTPDLAQLYGAQLDAVWDAWVRARWRQLVHPTTATHTH